MLDRPPRQQPPIASALHRCRSRSGSVEVGDTALRINAYTIGRTTDSTICTSCEAWRQRCAELRLDCQRRCSELEDEWRRRCDELERALAAALLQKNPSRTTTEVQTAPAEGKEAGSQAVAHLEERSCQTLSVPCGRCRGAGSPPEAVECGLQVGRCLDAISHGGVQTVEEKLSQVPVQTSSTVVQTSPRPICCDVGSWACLDDEAHASARRELLGKIDALIAESEDLYQRNSHTESENRRLQMQLELLMCEQCPSAEVNSSSNGLMTQHQRVEFHDRFIEFSRGPLDAGEFSNRFTASVAVAKTNVATAGWMPPAAIRATAARMPLPKKTVLPATAAAPDLPKRWAQESPPKRRTTAVATTASVSDGFIVLTPPAGGDTECVFRRTLARGGPLATKRRSTT